MHYYIDGYNLLFSLCEQTDPFEKKRGEIIAFLEEKLSKLSLSATVIFDAWKVEETKPRFHYSPFLDIIYSPKAMTADEFILEILAAKKSQPCTVVTSDKNLASKVRSLGFSTLSLSSFLKKIQKPKVQKEEETKQREESKKEFERLLRAFTQKDQ